jgi:hypothetical protein
METEGITENDLRDCIERAQEVGQQIARLMSYDEKIASADPAAKTLGCIVYAAAASLVACEKDEIDSMRRIFLHTCGEIYDMMVESKQKRGPDDV